MAFEQENNQVLPPKERTVLIVAGEASADQIGSNLVYAMRRLDPGIRFSGIGGQRMSEAGVSILIPASQLAVVGLTEVFSKLHRILSAYVRLKYILRNSPPDLLILMDYPDFNLVLAREAKRHRIPVLYYISPQVWAWRRGRVKKIAKRVDRMAVILPFEEAFYRRQGLDVSYVGHPLMDNAPPHGNRGQAMDELGLTGRGPILGLLPGSRNEEIKNVLPSLIGAAEILQERYPSLQCVLPLASTISAQRVLPWIRKTALNIRLFDGNIYKVLAACDLALVTSGTATLETAIMEVPMIIVYRVSSLTYQVAQRVVKVPHIGLVNLVAGKRVVPEFIQKEVTPRRLADEAVNILESGEVRGNMVKTLRRVKEMLGGGGASERTAIIALQMMGTYWNQ